MKKLILLFISLNLLSLPVFSSEYNRKPRVGALNQAIKKGNIEKVKTYIDAGADLNATYWTTWILWGTPVIGTAVTSRQNEMLNFLLNNGATPNPKSIVSPLYVAVIVNNQYAVKRLLEAGANQNKTFMGNTPKSLASAGKKYEIVSIFNNFNINDKATTIVTSDKYINKSKTNANDRYTFSLQYTGNNSNNSNFSSSILNINSSLKYYTYNGKNFEFNNLSKNILKSLSKRDKEDYLNAKKLEKKLVKIEYCSKTQSQKIKLLNQLLEKNPSFIPARYYLTRRLISTGNYNSAYNNMLILYKSDSYFDKNLMIANLGYLAFKSNNYEDTIKWLGILESEKQLQELKKYYFEYGYSHYSLNNYEKALSYLNKISMQSANYINALNTIYEIYIKQKKNNNALQIAYKLAKYDSKNPFQYIKVANATTDRNIKLKNYYQAKKLYLDMSNITELSKVDSLIASIEQSKIDNAVKNSKIYIDKPIWEKVIKGKLFIDTDVIYWSKRQDSFYEKTNKCLIYKGQNLANCFASINRDENFESMQRQKELQIIEQRQIAQRQAELQEMQIYMQQRAIQQNAINAMNLQNSINQLNNSINMPRTYTVNPVGNTLYINRY